MLLFHPVARRGRRPIAQGIGGWFAAGIHASGRRTPDRAGRGVVRQRGVPQPNGYRERYRHGLPLEGGQGFRARIRPARLLERAHPQLPRPGSGRLRHVSHQGRRPPLQGIGRGGSGRPSGRQHHRAFDRGAQAARECGPSSVGRGSRRLRHLGAGSGEGRDDAVGGGGGGERIGAQGGPHEPRRAQSTDPPRGSRGGDRRRPPGDRRSRLLSRRISSRDPRRNSPVVPQSGPSGVCRRKSRAHDWRDYRCQQREGHGRAASGQRGAA